MNKGNGQYAMENHYLYWLIGVSSIYKIKDFEFHLRED